MTLAGNPTSVNPRNIPRVNFLNSKNWLFFYSYLVFRFFVRLRVTIGGHEIPFLFFFRRHYRIPAT
jgi:hypothetical protein